MKKLTRISLVLMVVVLMMSLLSGFALASSGYVICTGGRTNVRNSPSLNGKDLYTLFEGEQVPYLGQSSVDDRGVTWYKIQYYSYGTGWVSSRYTRLSNSSGNWSGSTISASGSGTVSATGGSSNIRSNPSLNGYDIGTIPRGSSATYLGDSSVDDRGVRWYYVSYRGITGWVSSRYTTLYR